MATSNRFYTHATLRMLLSQAIKNTDRASVESLLIACSRIRYPFACISSLLELAIKHNHMEIIRLLISKGACVRSPRNSLKQNALHVAAMCRNKNVIMHILEYNVDLFAVDVNGANVLHLILTGTENKKKELYGVARDELSIIEILEIFLNLRLDVNECTKFSESPLELAIKNGMIEVAKLFITKGADPYFYDMYGDRLLRMLINYIVKQKYGNGFHSEEQVLNFVKWLQFKEIDIAMRNLKEVTPLQLTMKHRLETIVPILMEPTYRDLSVFNKQAQANLHVVLAKFGAGNCRENRIILNMIKKMLNEGADVNVVDKNGNTPLHIAAKRKNDQLICMMLKRFTNVNAQSIWGETVLHIFISNSIDANGKFEKMYDQYIRAVLLRGADVNIKNRKGMTAAQLAIQQRNHQILKILVDYGADLQVKTEDGDDLFQLLIGRSVGDDEHAVYKNIVDILLNNGFDVDELDKNGQTLLHRATMWADLQLIQVILEKGARVNCADKSLRRITPLHIALQLRTVPVVMTLLKFGADVNILTKDGESPLNMAITKFDSELINALLITGAQVNFANKDGESPLMKAVKKGDIEVIKLLLDYGADVNFRSKTSKLTALHVAAKEDQEEAVRILVKAGANVNARNALGETSLHFAARHQSSILETLVELGGNIYLLDNKSRSILLRTIECKNVVGLYYLLRIGQNINEIGNIQFTMTSLFSESTNVQMRTFILHHLIKLHAANLIVPRLYEYYIREHESYYEQCLNEVREMKKTFCNEASIYDFIHMRPESRIMFMNFFCIFSLHKRFPIYFSIIRDKRDEALDRKRLLESATSAWYEAIDIMLPELCLERIFDYTKNHTLELIIQTGRYS